MFVVVHVYIKKMCLVVTSDCKLPSVEECCQGRSCMHLHANDSRITMRDACMCQDWSCTFGTLFKVYLLLFYFVTDLRMENINVQLNVCSYVRYIARIFRSVSGWDIVECIYTARFILDGLAILLISTWEFRLD